MVPHCQVLPDGVLQVEVDLGAVEGAVPLVDDVGLPQVVQGVPAGRSVAISQSSSLPMLSSGLVDSSTWYLKPKREYTWSIRLATPLISSRICSGVMKMWASSWVKQRTRMRPWSWPDFSWRCTMPSSPIRRGRSR